MTTGDDDQIVPFADSACCRPLQYAILKIYIGFAPTGFLVVAKDGSPGGGKYYKANVDVLMAIDAVELCVEMRRDVVVLVTGGADLRI